MVEMHFVALKATWDHKVLLEARDLGRVRLHRRRRKYYAVSIDWDIYDNAVKEISSEYYTKISGAKGKLEKNYSLVVSCPKEHSEDLEELFDEIIWTPSNYYKDGPFSSENGENERFRTNRKALRYIEI